MPAKGAQHGLVDVFGFFVFAQPQPGGHGPGVGGGLAGLGFHGFFVHGRGFHILPGGGKNVPQLQADVFFVAVFLGHAFQKSAALGRLSLLQKLQARFNEAFFAFLPGSGLLRFRVGGLFLQDFCQPFQHRT